MREKELPRLSLLVTAPLHNFLKQMKQAGRIVSIGEYTRTALMKQAELDGFVPGNEGDEEE